MCIGHNSRSVHSSFKWPQHASIREAGPEPTNPPPSIPTQYKPHIQRKVKVTTRDMTMWQLLICGITTYARNINLVYLHM